MATELTIKQILIEALEFIEREAIIDVIGENNGEGYFEIKTNNNRMFTVTIKENTEIKIPEKYICEDCKKEVEKTFTCEYCSKEICFDCAYTNYNTDSILRCTNCQEEKE